MELINPGFGLVFWMTLSFLLLFFLLKKFAWKPILSMLQQREQKIEEALQAAEKARQEMEQLQVNNEKMLREARLEREKILSEARQLKEQIIEEARMQAREEAQRILEAARQTIEYEKMAALTDLKNTIGTIAIDIAEQLLQRELSSKEQHTQFIQQMIDKINLN